MNKLLITLLAIAATSAFATDYIYQSATIIDHGPGNAGSPWTTNLVFDTFDTQNGFRTLTAVRVSFTVRSWDGYVAADNDSGVSTASGDSSKGSLASLKSSDVILWNSSNESAWEDVVANTSVTFNLGLTTGDPIDEFNATGLGDYDRLDGPTEVNADSTTVDQYINDSWISMWDSPTPDTLAINFESVQQTEVFTGGDVYGAFGPSDANGEITITYEFVPEPSLALAFVGLVGLAARIRR